MKVEITEIRKKIIEVADDENIEENVLEKYNSLTDSDYSPMDTQMFYKILPKTPQQLGVKYDRKQLVKYIIKRADDKFSAISCMQLSIILYMLYEYYYTKNNVKLFEANFIAYKLYPKEKNTYSSYCFYGANTITPAIYEDTVNISTTDKNIIDRCWTN